MAFVQVHTDEFGNTYDSSYWRVEFLAVSIPDRSARAELHCYKDKASYQAGKKAITTRSYGVQGDTFLTYMAQYQSGAIDLFALSYQIAKDTLDVAAPTEEDPDHKVSFFANSEEVA